MNRSQLAFEELMASDEGPVMRLKHDSSATRVRDRAVSLLMLQRSSSALHLVVHLAKVHLQQDAENLFSKHD